MNKPTVKIVGYGIVGHNLKKLFPWAKVHDPFVDELLVVDPDEAFEYAFICVQTPMNDDGSCNTEYVEQAINETDADVIILKSTVPPGTTNRLVRETNKPIIFSPEYYGETHHANKVDYNFVILGGVSYLTQTAAQLFQHVYTGSSRIVQTDAVTAELVKYMENSFLATKVVFCNEFYRMATQLGVDYSELRELFILDPRAGASHTFVYEEEPYYRSKCLDKDVPGIVAFSRKKLEYNPAFLQSVINNNERFKKD